MPAENGRFKFVGSRHWQANATQAEGFHTAQGKGVRTNPRKQQLAMKKLGYLRISTYEQRPDRQINGLHGLCDELYTETLSAVSPHRPVYDSVIARLEPGDMLVVWDLDRAFRSVVDALTESEKLKARGIEFHIANMHVDTSTPGGMFIYTILSALAEFERNMLIQRTKEGMEAARQRGVKLGRPRKLSDAQVAEAKHQIAQGLSTPSELAKHYAVSRWTVERAVARELPLNAKA